MTPRQDGLPAYRAFPHAPPLDMISNELFLIILLSAAMNAGWNAAIKIGGDKIAVMALITLTGSAFSALALPFVTMPDRASWMLLALSIAIHTAYHFVLPLAYRYGDLGLVYPLARGSAPLLVTAGAAILVGELPPFWGMVGVACLCVGVIALSFDRAGTGRDPRGVAYALGTGLLIAAYTVVDALGGRQSGSPIGFAVLLTLGDGIATCLIVLFTRGTRVFRVDLGTVRLCAAAGLLQVAAYWIAVWALSHAPMGMVSALRETSVLFVALISTFVLKERPGLFRLMSAVGVCAGIALIRFGH